MGTYTNPDGSKQLVSFEGDIWAVEAIDETTRKLHLKSIRTDTMRLVSSAQVEPVDHETLLQAAVAKIADKTAKRALILGEDFTPEQKELARHRFEIIEKQIAGNLLVDEAAKECGLSVQRYYEVRKMFSAEAGIISLLGKKRGRKKGTKAISPEVEKIIADQVWLFRGEDASYRSVWKGVQAACYELKIDNVPSYETVCDRMNNLSKHLRDLQVHGKNHADDAFKLRDGFRELSRALEQVQMDHTVADVFLASRYDRKNPVGRPWITVAVCAKTKVILGFYISFRYPSLASVAHTLKHAVMSKEAFMKSQGLKDHEYEFYGVFDELLTDNAREFRSGNLVAACALEGIKLQHRHQKQDGGICERALGTLNIGYVHMLPGGTGSRSRKDRDFNPQKHAVMTLEEFTRYFTLAVCEYHDTVGEDGKTPRDRWLEALRDAKGRPVAPRRVHDVKNFIIEVLPEKHPVMSKTGLKVNGFRYSNDVLRHMIGKRIRVKYDPANLSVVLARFEGQWIEVPCCEKTPGTLTAKTILQKYLKRAGKLGERAMKAFLARSDQLRRSILLDTPAMRKQLEINDADREIAIVTHHQRPSKKTMKAIRNFALDVEPFEGE
jgi:putative transposase